MCVAQVYQSLCFSLDVQDPKGQLSLVAAQVAELEAQLAMVTARLQALEAAAGQGVAPAALLPPHGGAADAAGAPDGLRTPHALSLGPGAGDQAPLALLLRVCFCYHASSFRYLSSVMRAVQT